MEKIEKLPETPADMALVVPSKNSSATKSKADKVSFSKKLIMVVDDDSDIRETIKTVLEANGFSVVTAVNADDCLKKLKIYIPALILMDIMMPGTPVKDAILQIDKSLKIAYISVVRTSDAEKEELLKIGNIVAFIQKPFDINNLIKQVKKIIG